MPVTGKQPARCQFQGSNLPDASKGKATCPIPDASIPGQQGQGCVNLPDASIPG
jgi:hypothetical protein